MNKTTGNELIADRKDLKAVEKFMGYADGYLSEKVTWNDVMPPVLKISKEPLEHWDGTPCTDIIDTCYPITFNMPTENGKVMFRFKGFSLHEADTLIEAVWQAVIEFITWHTKQN